MIDRTGEILDIKPGKVKIIRYQGALNCTVKFVATGSVVENLQYANIKRGAIKDPLAPIIFDIGFFGQGPFSKAANKRLYNIWYKMLSRCYDEKFLEKYPSYVGCTVTKRWLNFQNFCEDITKMKNWNTPGFELDKDLRVLGNKKYGPKYCSFVPKEINSRSMVNVSRDLPVGVSRSKNKFRVRVGNRHGGYYKTAKQAGIAYSSKKQEADRVLAKRYKSSLHPEVYRNLMG